MPSEDKEESDAYGGVYENGHWVWDETCAALAFVSNTAQVKEPLVVKKVVHDAGLLHFRDDIDLIEQLRFRHRYQRKVKAGEPDVITLQDVKDLAIFTAPTSLLSNKLIDLLHVPTTERLLRALILYCQYYLQVSDKMAERMEELMSKVCSQHGELIEHEYRENLCDLRLLATKEYCTVILGGDDTKRFHHKGSQKKMRSLNEKDAVLFETFTRMAIQIVWLALGRRSFNKIELELNRLFKSETYNRAEHKLKTGYVEKMSHEERNVLFGCCVRHERKLNICSPLLNEVFCVRPIDWRMLSLGLNKSMKISPRLLYMQRAISAPEESLPVDKVVVGILGQERSDFDTMINPIQRPTEPKQSITSSNKSITSQKSTTSKKSAIYDAHKLYQDIDLPPKEIDDGPLLRFPIEVDKPRPCSGKQRRLWQQRLIRLLYPRTISNLN